MSIESARRFLTEHNLRMTLADDDGTWFVVKTHEGEVVAEAPSYMLAVRRARAALRKTKREAP